MFRERRAARVVRVSKGGRREGRVESGEGCRRERRGVRCVVSAARMVWMCAVKEVGGRVVALWVRQWSVWENLECRVNPICGEISGRE